MLGGAEADSGGLALLGFAGTYLAPGFGHWYQDRFLTRGLGVRTVGLGLFAWAVYELLGCDTDCPDLPRKNLLVAGFIVYLGGTVDDIITAPLEARKHNKRLEVTGIAPMVTGRGAGLALAGRF